MATSPDTVLTREMSELYGGVKGLRGHGFMMPNVMLLFVVLEENVRV